ncbi:unnamed protein product [Rotaria sp. Silwood1]|nr:unnamed protein product [Rotaria sp. Silwood1]CAF4675148.1 unnamed protein product [Rotaria sp. Silwood1]CAF4752264.1 unnamed protein product [Rotaria sp. Silwood1]
MRKDLAEKNPTRLFGKLLIDMGQYSRAKRYYQLVLNSLRRNHDNFLSLYHGLGYTHYVRGNYDQALTYDRIAYEIRKQTLRENHLDVARSSLSLGYDYVRSGDYKTAIELLMEALRIPQQNYSEPDHIYIHIMLRIINSSNRALAQRIIRPILTFTRAELGTDAEAGSVASGNDAFSKREHAEEARWARRHDAEQIAKYRSEHPPGSQATTQGTPQQRLAALEAEKRRIEQEIEQVRRQQQR